MKNKTICEIIPRVRERVARDGVDMGPLVTFDLNRDNWIGVNTSRIVTNILRNTLSQKSREAKSSENKHKQAKG